MWRKIKQFGIVMLSAFLLAGCEAQSTGTADRKMVRKESAVSSDMEVHFLDVGQGDCTLIRSGEHAMLIDGGNNKWGKEIQSYLESKGIRKLDYIIGTHPDADHVGGLDIVIQNTESAQLLVPDVSKDTRTYEEVIEAAEARNTEIRHPKAGERYELGEAVFTVVAPNGSKYDNINEYSIGILLEHGENSFLFVGDAEEQSEREMVQKKRKIDADVYKVSHHGSRTATGDEFLAAVSPEYAVISCGEGNSYGHPHADVLNRLRQEGIKIFRTDDQGTIVASSDGQKLQWNMSPTDNWTPGEPTGSQTAQKQTVSKTPKKTDTEKQTTYVVNVNTKKFHLPGCPSASEIKKSNRQEMKATKKEMIKKGYAPCRNCIR